MLQGQSILGHLRYLYKICNACVNVLHFLSSHLAWKRHFKCRWHYKNVFTCIYKRYAKVNLSKLQILTPVFFIEMCLTDYRPTTHSQWFKYNQFYMQYSTITEQKWLNRLNSRTCKSIYLTIFISSYSTYRAPKCVLLLSLLFFPIR